MKKKLLRDKKGFTLVELIVVLVILAILIALLVPALTGYIDKARKKTKIAECRLVVEAAQTCLSEMYGAAEGAELSDLSTSLNQPDTIRAILDLAEVSGKLEGNILIASKAVISKIVYIATDGTRVIYEKEAEPQYRVEDGEAEYTNDAPGYLKWASDLSTEDYAVERFLDADEKVKEEYKKYFGDASWDVKNSISRRLQAAYLEKYGSYQSVDWEQVKLPSNINKPDNSEKYVWKPIVATNNTPILVAEETGKMGQAKASIVYYEGNYYYHPNWKGNGVGTATIMDKAEFDLTTLGDGKNWIKIE